MTNLLVGFDSAWTATNSGALVGVLRHQDGSYRELGDPVVANYHEAQALITLWQAEESCSETIILLDQPTIVGNATGQRPVENIAAAPVSRRYGGMQPANTARADMFGPGAPIWPFLARFGGAADPLEPALGTTVFETYPVLAMIALGWMVPDARPGGRLPKYNPARKKTFLVAEWRHVCELTLQAMEQRGLSAGVKWLNEAAGILRPRKRDQDCLDAYLCLLVALHLAEGSEGLMVGDVASGYIVVPYGEVLHRELGVRCEETGRDAGKWVRGFRLGVGQGR